MTRVQRLTLAMLLGCLTAMRVPAAETTALDGYLNGLSTWSANFTQTVEDAKHKSAAGSHGRLVIVRPGKLRWESSSDGTNDAAQLLIADGKNLWSLDLDLNEATVQPLAEAPPQSPAMLLAGSVDLHAAFTVQANGKHDGFDWVRVLPRDKASDFREVQFGFKGQELARMVILDKLGQRATLSFKDVKRNAPVDPGLMQFVPPDGVDVIGKRAAP